MKLDNSYILALNEVKDISSHFLTSLDLTMFAYSRVFSDGSRSELWTDSKALQHSFIDKKYITDFYTPSIYEENEKYVFLPHKVEFILDKKLKQKYQKQLFDQKNIFDNDNCFNIVKKSEKLCEYFIFYTSSKFRDPINFYFNKINLLEKFIDEFKTNTIKLVRIADENKIVKTHNEIIGLQHNHFNCDISNSIDDCKIKLNKRELQICRDIVHGKTAMETAMNLGLSVRTIEKYIEFIKSKFFCNRKTDLAVKLLQLRLI